MHRRINPKAVVFGDDQQFKLTNFDAIRVEKAIDRTKTMTTAVISEDGQFQAPEFGNAESNPSCKYKIDVWSVGMIMCYMATAVKLYTEDPQGNWYFLE